MQTSSPRARKPWEAWGFALWRGLTSPWAVGAFLLIVALVLCLAALGPQPSSGSQSTALRQLGGARGALVNLAQGVQLLLQANPQPAWLLRLLAASGAGLAILRLLRLWVVPWALPPVAGRRQTLAFACPTEEAVQHLSQAAALTGHAIIRRFVAGPLEVLLARRAGVAGWAFGLGGLGVLLLSVALLVSGSWGWRGPALDLVLGERRVLGPDTPLSVQLEQIALLPAASGGLRRFESSILVQDDSGVGHTLTLAPGQPVLYHGLIFYQLGYGPAVRVSAQDDAGKPLPLRTMVGDAETRSVRRVRFGEEEQEQLLAIPAANLIVRLVYYTSLPAQGIAGQVVHVQLLDGASGQVIREQFLQDGGTLQVEGATVDLAMEYAVALRAGREPGLVLVLAGAILLLLGLLARLHWRPREFAFVLQRASETLFCQIVVARREPEAAWRDDLLRFLREAADARLVD